MKINELSQKPDLGQNIKLQEAYQQFEKLLAEVRKKDLPDGVVMAINTDLEALNSASGSADVIRQTLKKTQTRILKLLEKETKLVPRNYYRNLWLALGMGAIGVPIGVAFGAMLGNMAYLGLGLPIGLSIGVAAGATMDKKALEEGRQLDVEIKH